MKHFIESHMTLLLIAGCIAGLVWPAWNAVPDKTVIVILMIATYLACFKLSAADMQHVRWWRMALFLPLRFILLPLILYALALGVLPGYATAILLVALLPTGVSVPAMVNVFGGNVSYAAVMTLVATIAAPFVIPLIFSWLGGTHITAPTADMFYSLLVILILPCMLYLFTRRIRRLKAKALEFGKSVTIALIAVMIAIVVGKQRTLILADPLALALAILLSLLLFIILLWAGWLYAARERREERITVATCSGYNNAALGVSIALLHFTPEIVVFTVGAELAWAALPFVSRWFGFRV